MTDYSLWKSQIEAAWEDRSLLQQPQTLEAIEGIIAAIDAGALRSRAYYGRLAGQ